MKVWRVLISSPGDVKPSRISVSDAVRMVNKALEAAGKDLQLKLCGWPEDVVPGAHAESAQRLIEEQLRFDDCDIVIGIFWRKLGTPVLGAPSGSASEILIAHDAWKRNKRPEILTYFNREAAAPPSSPAEAADQLRLTEFKEELRAKHILTADYDGDPELVRLVYGHLLEIAFGSSTKAPLYLRPRLRCYVEADLADLRSQGVAELVGDIRLRFEFPPVRPAERHELDIDLVLSTHIARPSNGVPPRLIVRDASGEVLVVEGRLIEDIKTFNRVRFERVSVLVDHATRLVISNIRANANLIGIAATFQSVPVAALMSILEGAHEIGSGDSIRVGMVKHGMYFSPIGCDGHRGVRVKKTDLIRAGSLRACSLRFEEAFAGAFKTLSQESGVSHDSPTGSISPPRADSGTRLGVAFYDVPEELELYVTVRDEPDGEPAASPRAILLTGCDVRGAGGAQFDQFDITKSQLIPGSTLPYARVQAPGYAFWEWVQSERSDGVSLRRVCFTLAIVARRELNWESALMMVAGTLAPFDLLPGASHGLVPRFRPGTAPINIVVGD